jgi:hypothetical protein
LVSTAYSSLLLVSESGPTLPANSSDSLRRNLDCAVMRRVHSMLDQIGAAPLDSVRGVFVEGKPIYESAGFYSKTHLQIAVCNPAYTKGVPKEQLAGASR